MCLLAMFASCSGPKKTTAPPPPPPKPVKVETRAEQISRKYDIRFSGIADTFALKVQKVEKLTMNSATTSIDDELQNAAAEFKRDCKTFLKEYISEWEKYVEDSTKSRIEHFKRVSFTGKYIKVPRVLQILEEPVKRGGITKTFKDVLPEGFDLGKTMFYFMRGGDTTYHLSENALIKEMTYYDTLCKEPVKVTPAKFASVISKYIQSDTSYFSTGVKVIRKESYRNIYAAQTALEYWIDWTAQKWADYIYAAARINVHKGQALH